jgi:hypothetical protein
LQAGFGLGGPLVISTGWEQTTPPQMNAEELEKRIDELALEFAKTHDEEVKAELEALRGRVAAMKGRLV